MYTIYRIKELDKVGVTSRDISKRLEEQGFKLEEAQILMTTNDLKEASDAEERFRTLYGYKKDDLETYYKKMAPNVPVSRTGRKFIRPNDRSVGLNQKLKNRAELEDYLTQGPITLGTKRGSYTFSTPIQIHNLIISANESQYPGSDYYWNSRQLELAYNK